MPASPAARAIRRPPDRDPWRRRRVIAKLAEIAMRDERSPLFGAGNAGVVARAGRLLRRDDESRSEAYAEILTRAGLAEVEGRAKRAFDPAAQSNTPCTRTARYSRRSRSIRTSASSG